MHHRKLITQLNVLANDLYEVVFQRNCPTRSSTSNWVICLRLCRTEDAPVFLDYPSRKSFALMEMDTDSCYVACAASSFEAVINWKTHAPAWFHKESSWAPLVSSAVLLMAPTVWQTYTCLFNLSGAWMGWCVCARKHLSSGTPMFKEMLTSKPRKV